MEALSKNAKAVPYRNHKLTMFLQDFIGGTSKAVMFVNCTPASCHLDETCSSLKFASRWRKMTIQTQATRGPICNSAESSQVAPQDGGQPANQQPVLRSSEPAAANQVVSKRASTAKQPH